MDTQYGKKRRLYLTAYLAVLLALAVHIFLPVKWGGSRLETAAGRLADFSEGWTANGGEVVDTDEISAAQFGGSVTLEKTLPETISYNARLCLAGANIRLTVYIDDMPVYAYDCPENLTGKGYGIAYHSIDLTPEQAGKTVRMEVTSVYENHKGGQLYGPSIGSEEAFRADLVKGRLILIAASIGLLLLGALMLLFYLLMPWKKRTRFDFAALTLVTLIIGLWTTNDTGILRFMTGQVVTDRVIDHAMLHLLVFPLTLLVSSVTRERKPVYLKIIFALTLLDITVFLVLRYAFHLDMAWLPPVLAVYYASTFVVVGAMLTSDKAYCRANNIPTDRELFNAGLLIAGGTIIIDVIVYFSGVRSIVGRGFTMRIGFAAFAVLMILQAIRWWVADRTTATRDRFINKALQYAVSANDPETSIRALLEYLGTELHAKHTYLFEDRGNGTFTGTYDWFAEGVEQPRTPEQLELPYRGLIDELYEVFKREGRFIVHDREESRGINATLYEVLRVCNVERTVVGPLEANGKLIGLFGVDDAPVESLMEISEIIRLIAYFFAQLVLQRDEQKRLLRYSYYDAMTGCRNRRALSEYERHELDVARPYGFVMCDINGLKKINDTEGHEAGDALIADVADSLAAVYGEENVYRMGGDEFAVYVSGGDDALFSERLERFRALLAEKKRSAAIGAVFRPDGDRDYEKVKAEADGFMYEDKRRYYQGADDRRR